MTDDDLPDPGPVPPIPTLGPAQAHRAVAESAALHHDFTTALRERFRAVVRGMEQGGLLEVRRSRTARETADLAATTVRATELPDAARSFDEVVYGGRPAGEAEYRLLEQADRYSLAPPPPDEPVETPTVERRAPSWRVPPLPDLLRDRRFWAVVLGALLIALIVYLLLHLSGAPKAPPLPQRLPPNPGEPPPLPPPTITGSDSIFGRLPHWLAFGGLQWLVCAAIVVWWRARRRGALVGEPRPVQVAANEVLAGQAALYRKSKDYNHVVGKLRTATLRRIRPALNLTADAPPDRVIAAIAARIGSGIGTAAGSGFGGTAAGADPHRLGATLFGPAADDGALEMYAAELDRIEREIG
ncbi:DUF4129 domain-containing protein [Nocardia alni]|uniref:DUF4129 domain-containing protein n=1 Tax=Nocardia alni TaxID=2815723 RepID=UPI0027DF37CF|nr:DUF4129 domain-containing protein [Nocardia alni]